MDPKEHLALVAHALSDLTRVRLLSAVSGDQMTPTELAELLGVSRSTILFHSQILANVGLLGSDKKGRRRFLFARLPELRQLIPVLLGCICDGPQSRSNHGRSLRNVEPAY